MPLGEIVQRDLVHAEQPLHRRRCDRTGPRSAFRTNVCLGTKPTNSRVGVASACDPLRTSACQKCELGECEPRWMSELCQAIRRSLERFQMAAYVVDQNAKTDQEYPQREDKKAPAKIVAAEQKKQRQHIAENRQLTWGNPGVDCDRGRRDHADARHLDHVHVHEAISGSAGEVERRGTDQLLGFHGKSD